MRILTGKILKEQGEKISELETTVATSLTDLELNQELRASLRDLHITGAREVDVQGRKVIVVFVPFPQLRAYQKIHQRLVRELEKKFSQRYVVLVASRRVLPKATRKSRVQHKQTRPRSRTLTSVHEAVLADIVYPAEIVGKRTHYKADGSQIIKVHLEKAQEINLSNKIEVFAGIYKRLTGKDVHFEFPEWSL